MADRGWRQAVEDLKRRLSELLADLDDLLTLPPEPVPVPVRPDRSGRRGGRGNAERRRRPGR